MNNISNLTGLLGLKTMVVDTARKECFCPIVSLILVR